MLVGHISNFNPVSVSHFDLFHAAIATRHGSDPVAAQLVAMKLMDLQLTRQASMLSYNRVFFLMAVCFVLIFPLILLLRGGRGTHGSPKSR